MSTHDPHITAAPLTIDGVDEMDPTGRIPLEQLINGTVLRIPRWDRFPVPPSPGQPNTFSILRVFWGQGGRETKIFEETYTYLDDKPQFVIPLSAEQMAVDGVAYIYYQLEGYDGNFDPSPSRQLTIDHTLLPTLNEPAFLDAMNGYLNCSVIPPIWEKMRITIYPERIFREFDECELKWQGFDSLNGSGNALTPLYRFTRALSASEAANGLIMEIPFEPYIRPMIDNDSGLASYTLLRNRIPVALSHVGLVRIDRTRPSEPPCGGPAVADVRQAGAFEVGLKRLI